MIAACAGAGRSTPAAFTRLGQASRGGAAAERLIRYEQAVFPPATARP
jgi:hypothetical protein